MYFNFNKDPNPAVLFPALDSNVSMNGLLPEEGDSVLEEASSLDIAFKPTDTLLLFINTLIQETDM